MALEKSKLLIEIEAKTGGSVSNISKVEDGLAGLEGQTRATSRSTEDFSDGMGSSAKRSKKLMTQIKKMQDRYKMLAKQIKDNGFDKANNDTLRMVEGNQSLLKTVRKLSSSETNLSKNMQIVSDAATNANTNIIVLNQTLGNTSTVNDQAAKSYERQAESMGVFSKSMEAVSGLIAVASRGIGIFTTAIELLGDPEKAKQLVLILRFLSSILGLKGYGVIADGLDNISTKVESLSTELVSFRDSIFTAFKVFTAFAKSEIIQTFFDALEISVAGLVLILGASVGTGLVMGLDDLRVSLGLTDNVIKVFLKTVKQKFLTFDEAVTAPMRSAGKKSLKIMAVNSRAAINNTSNTLSTLTKAVTQFAKGFSKGFVDLGEIITFSSSAEGATLKRVTTFGTRYESGLREGFERSAKTFQIYDKQVAMITKSLDRTYIRNVENSKWMFHQISRDSKKGIEEFIKPFQKGLPAVRDSFGKGLTDTVRISTKLMAGSLITLSKVASITLSNILFSVGELTGAMLVHFSRSQRSFDLLLGMFARSKSDITRIILDMSKTFGKMGILMLSPFVGGAAAVLDDFIDHVRVFSKLSSKMMAEAMIAYRDGFSLIKESIDDLVKVSPKSMKAFSNSLNKNMLVPIDALGTRNVAINSIKKSLVGLTQVLKGITKTFSAVILGVSPFSDILLASNLMVVKVAGSIANLVSTVGMFKTATTSAQVDLAVINGLFGQVGRSAFIFGTTMGDVAQVAFPIFISQVKRVIFDLRLLSSVVKDLLSASMFALSSLVKDTSVAMNVAFNSGARSGSTMVAVLQASFMSMSNTLKEFAKTSKDAMIRFKNSILPALNDMAASTSIAMIKMVAVVKSGFDGMVTATIAGAKHFKTFAMGFGKGFLEPSKMFVAGMSKMKASATSFGASVAKAATPSLLGFVEAGTAVAPLILSFSASLLNSDSIFVKIAASIALVSALLMTTFATAVTVLASQIGSLLISAGDKLLGVMDKMAAKFVKAQKAAALTTTVIEGFGRVMGVEAVGSVDRWNKVMDEVGKKTLFAGSSISKGLKVMIAEGAALGLSANQIEMFFKRATDVAEGSAKDFEDVAGRFATALTGSVQGLANMGIMVNAAAIDHSKYAKNLGKTSKTMTEAELVQARFNVTMENTVPFVGAAVAATETIAGANALYAKSIDDLQTKLGSMNDFTVVYTQTVTGFVRVLGKLPTVLLDIISISIDFLGVTLKVIGVIVKYGIAIFTIKTLYGFAAAAVAKFGFVQIALSATLNLVNAKLGIQAVSIKTLAGLWAALGNILKVSVVQGFKNLVIMMEVAITKTLVFSASVVKSIFSLKFWGAAMGKVAIAAKFMMASIIKATIAIRANPLLMMAALVVTGLVIVGKAVADVAGDFKELSGAVDENSKAIGSAGEKTGILRKMFEKLKKSLASVGSFVMSLTKLVVTGLLLAFLKTLNVFFKVAKAMGGLGIEQEKLENGIRNTNKAINEANQLAIKYGVNALTAFEDTAEAAEKVEEKLNSLKGVYLALGKVQDALGKASIDSLERQSTIASALGTEYEAATAVVAKADSKLQAVSNTILKIDVGHGKKLSLSYGQISIMAELAAKGNEKLAKTLSKLDPKEIEKVAQKLKEAKKESIAAALSLESLNRETFLGFSEIQKSLKMENKDLTAQIIKDAEKRKVVTIASIAEEGKSRLEAFNAAVEGLRKLKKLKTGSALFHKKEASLIRSTRKEILANTKALIELEKVRQVSKAKADAAEKLGDELDIILQLMKAEKDIAKLGGNRVKILEANLKMQLAQISLKQMDLDLSNVEEAALFRKLETLKKITKEQGNKKIDEAKPLNIRNLLGGGDLSQFMVDAVGDMAKAISKISFADIKKGLQDSGKSFLQFFKNIPSLDGIGKSLMSAGKGFVESVKGITLAGTIDSLKSGFKSASDFIMDIDLAKVGAGIKAAFSFGSSLISGLATMFNPANIVAVGDTLKAAFTEIPQAISAALQELPAIMQKFAENFGEILNTLLASLPELIQAVLNALPQVVQAILDGIVSIIQALPSIVQGIIEKIPEILSQLLAAIPTIITALLEAIPQIVNMLMAQLPQIIIQLVQAVPAIIEALVSGLIGAAAEIAIGFIDTFIVKGGAVKMSVAIVKAIAIDLPKAILKGIASGLKRAFDAVFNGIKIPLPAIDTKKLTGSLDKAMSTVSKKASQASEDLFSIIDLDAVGGKKAKGKDGEKDTGMALLGNTKKSIGIWKTFLKFMGKLFDNLIKKPFMWVWDNIISPIFGVISSAFGIVAGIYDTLGEVVDDAFGGLFQLFDNLTGIVDKAFGWIFDQMKGWPNIFQEPFKFIKTVFDVSMNGIRAVFTFFREMIKPVVKLLKSPFVFLQEVGKSLQKLFTDPIQALKEIGASTAKLLMAPFVFLKESIKPLLNLGTTLGEGLKKAISGIGDLLMAPFKDLANLIDFSSLGKKIKDIILAPWRLIGNLMEKIFKVDFKGKGKVESAVGIDIPFVNFAKGGEVGGTASVGGDSELNDKVLALLSPGERIIPRSALQDPNVVRVIDAVIKSGKLPKFAVGGVIGQLARGDGKGALSSTKKGLKKADPTKLFENAKAMIEKKATGFLKDMLEANALSSGGTVKGIPLPAIDASDFQLTKPTPQGSIPFGAGVGAMGGLKSGNTITKNFTVKIEEGAIQITSEGGDSEEIAAEIFEQIKRRSADGEFLFSNEGGRETA